MRQECGRDPLRRDQGNAAFPCALFVLLVAVPIVILFGSAMTGYGLDEVAIDVVGLAAYGGVAGVVIFRCNGHRVGWLLLALGATLVSVSRLLGVPGVPSSAVRWAESSGWPFLFSLFAALTLVFPLVSAVLVEVYLIAGFVLGTLLPLRGELAVAGSTLLAAALVKPLRRLIKTAVDMRFNRSRFDAERTMEAFSRRLSSEVDLAELGRELQAVANQTMQPTNVSVCLRGESA